MNEVVIFAPSPVLTVTIEDHPEGADVHLHAGGQGVWQARMLLRLGVKVTMCSVLTGESGRVLRHLLADEGIDMVTVDRHGRGGAYVHDRRGGQRIKLIDHGGEPLSRHDLDELYGITLGQALGVDIVILSGPAGEKALPADVYRRLAADLGKTGCRVIVDLAGDRLKAALAGGVELAKVSDEELLADGRITEKTVSQLVAAMHSLHAEGAKSVIVTRAHEPLLLLAGGVVTVVTMPTMQVADETGAGDSLTAGVAAALAGGASLAEAITVGAAAGALNVTRHGLGTGDPQTIERLRQHVVLKPLEPSTESASFSPGQLAARLEERS